MLNELLFLAQISIISVATLLFARWGKESLTSYVAILFVMANIFVIQQINLFGWTVTSSDAFIIGISFSINLLQEFFDKAFARKAVWISFAISLFYLIISQCIMTYIPAPVDDAHVHLAHIMSNTPRIIIASFISYLITQFTDIAIYGLLKQVSNGKYFVARNYASLCFSQFLDTILFSFLGLYGIVENIGDIIVVSYSVKLIAIVCATPFLILAKRYVQSVHST